MRKVSFTAAFVLAISLFWGCGTQPGYRMVTFDAFSKTPPPVATAHAAGEYKLYSSDSRNPVYTAFLQPGDKYGFDKDTNGKVVAIAKEEQIPLTAKLATEYYWRQDEK